MRKAYVNIASLLTLEDALTKQGRFLSPDDLSVIENAAVIFNNEKIEWVGRSDELPDISGVSVTDLRDHTVTPELVDCHTHVVFAGNRAHEYAMRLNGADYATIAKAGGGILHTTKATNEASYDELYNLARERVRRINSYGVGTIEIKSGYGLNFEKEYEISKVIAALKKEFAPKIQIKNTYLAAHAVPKQYKSSNDYMTTVVLPLLEKLSSEKIIDAADIFFEVGYFDAKDSCMLFDRCKDLGIPVKIHADEFNDNGGATLAARYSALSADHLMMTGDLGINDLSKSDTVSVLLPGTSFFLGKKLANARKFLDFGCRVALASDYNPGSCHFDNLLMIASLAAPQYKLNQCEMWASITLNSAKALGLANQGAIVPGLAPRFAIFKAKSPDEITYNWGRNLHI